MRTNLSLPRPPRPFLTVSAALGLAALAAACLPLEMPGPDEGGALFAENCAHCHGDGGKGDGPMAAGLSPPPADLTALAARAGGRFDRARVLSVIDGYARNRIDRAMPEFGALLEGPLVPVDTGDGVMTPTPRPLAALLAYLESVQG